MNSFSNRQNADPAICESVESLSNVIVERVMHDLKQSYRTTSTDEGMQIDQSDEHTENALSSIRDTLDPLSNVTAKRFMHS
jgi:hypothetical protein